MTLSVKFFFFLPLQSYSLMLESSQFQIVQCCPLKTAVVLKLSWAQCDSIH